MKILFISKDLIAGDIARRLQNEGHEVKLFIEEHKAKQNLTNLVPKTDNWRKELKWVGKDGLIVFDDIGYGKIQDDLRKDGYSVFGGSELGERLELDREFGSEVFRECGMTIAELRDFNDIKEAVSFLSENQGPWVVKHNTHKFKNFTFIGSFDDNRDSIVFLKNLKIGGIFSSNRITLQKRIKGIEIGVGRFFNGKDWVGPIEMNVEHTKFFPGDLGPTTSEMGTLAWYDDNENNKIFQNTIAKLKDFLVKADYRGDVSINSIVNEDGVFPLEATMRFGSPIAHLQEQIHESDWGDFLKAIADGKSYDLKWNKGFGVVLMIASAPFPYTYELANVSLYNNYIYLNNLTKDEMNYVHFEEVSLKEGTQDTYYVSDVRGYLMYVTSVADTILEAQKKANDIASKIVIPNAFFRNDIGSEFNKNGINMLKSWGYDI